MKIKNIGVNHFNPFHIRVSHFNFKVLYALSFHIPSINHVII